MPTTTLEKRLTKTEDRLDRLEQLILQQSINITKSQQETAELKIELEKSNKRMEQGFAELRQSQRQGFAELRETIAQVDKENAQGFAELRKSHKELNKKWGELSNRLGTIVEDLVAPSLERIFFEITKLPQDSEILVHTRRKGRHPITRLVREFDALVESEKYLLVNETKSKLMPEDVPKFLTALTEFYNYFPSYKDQGLTIIGAMSSMQLDESLITVLSKKGLLALAIGNSITTIKNPLDFEWKAF